MKKLLCGGISTCDVYAKGVEFIPAPGTAEEVENIFFQMGGGAANAMVDYCKLGGACTLCIRVGKDYAGKIILDTLQPYHEQMELSVAYDDGPTAITIAVTGNRDRSFLACLGTTLKFCKDDIPKDKIQDADIVYISGACLMHGFDCPDLTEFFKYCKELGKITVLDTSPDMRNIWLPSIEEALPYIDYFIPSFSEANALSNLTEADEIVDFFVVRGTSNILLKMGSDGVYIRTPDDTRRWAPGFQVNVVDTTGAGDSFCAGFCYGLANSWSIDEAARFGNAVGAFCVSHTGACTGIPTAEEVISFIQEHSKYEKKGQVIL